MSNLIWPKARPVLHHGPGAAWALQGELGCSCDTSYSFLPLWFQDHLICIIAASTACWFLHVMLVVGRLLVGCWLAAGRLLVGCWLAADCVQPHYTWLGKLLLGPVTQWRMVGILKNRKPVKSNRHIPCSYRYQSNTDLFILFFSTLPDIFCSMQALNLNISSRLSTKRLEITAAVED